MHKERAIAIGGSSGSIAALKQIVPRLLKDVPAAIFVVVHVGAYGRNLLGDILDSSGSLSVTTAVDGEPAEAGRVYVAPADRHLLVIDGVIRLGRGPRENMSRPSIDALFRSVAVSYGSSAIGLVLTGNLNDGAAGLAAIKQMGGLTAVQNPADAEAPDMPLGALEASDVDYRAPLADLPDLITAMAREPPGSEPASRRELELEVEIALGRPCRTETIAEIADVAPLSCPDCGGTLSQLKQPPLRFRCQVGHAYSANALADQHEGSIDEALRVALRIVEERAVLAERMARDANTAGRTHAHEDYLGKAAELRASAEVLRAAALRLMS
ncbi:chemotaxis protein CheB [Marivita sp.]|uniref:chemotaxis protein CheB n=1 Tax=Marivita sp. TaxID=2003365 RepID=UPI0025C4AB13|nr:chemotaxis protein CheB [Marivita sp.]